MGVLSLSGCSLLEGGGNEPARDEQGQVTESVDDGDVFAVKVGDCLAASGEGEVSEVPITPCDQPHESEAFHAFEVEGDEFPGGEALETEAAACQEEFATYIGKPYQESTLEVTYFSPTQESWEQLDDREILCLVYDPEGDTTGSLKGSGK